MYGLGVSLELGVEDLEAIEEGWTSVAGEGGEKAGIEEEAAREVDEVLGLDKGDDVGSITDFDSPTEPHLKAVDPSITTPTGTIPDDPHLQHFAELEAEFLSLSDTSSSPAGPPDNHTFEWRTTYHKTRGNFSFQIDERTGYDFFFRYVMTLEASPEEAFDLLATVDRRPDWDELCDEGGTVEKTSNWTSIQFFRTKGVWPTKPRYALVESCIRKLGPSRYLNVTRSIPSHPDFTPQKGNVCMTAHIAGQLVEPDPEGRQRMCRVVQIVHGDLGGWLPKSVVNAVTREAIPAGMRKVNNHLRAMGQQKTRSDLIAEAERVSRIIPSKDLTTHMPQPPQIGLQTAEDDIPMAAKAADGPSSPALAARRQRIQSSDQILPSPPSVTTPHENPPSSHPATKPVSTALINRSNAGRQLFIQNNALRTVLNILRFAKPWVIISLLLSLITGRRFGRG
ncbi:hypothetical protein DFS34DRAFT_576076 [Phlyctochytrium arcticum]|nr:hypothetical protein DFS34DRAFT_576076 [Phlyctochytrium arcticum]